MSDTWRPTKTTGLSAVLWVAVALVVGAWGVREAFRIVRVAHFGTSTLATVIDAEEVVHDEGLVNHVRYRFSYNSRRFTGTTRAPGLEVGDTLRVNFDRADPTLSRTPGDRSGIVVAILLVVGAGAAIRINAPILRIWMKDGSAEAVRAEGGESRLDRLAGWTSWITVWGPIVYVLASFQGDSTSFHAAYVVLLFPALLVQVCARLALPIEPSLWKTTALVVLAAVHNPIWPVPIDALICAIPGGRVHTIDRTSVAWPW